MYIMTPSRLIVGGIIIAFAIFLLILDISSFVTWIYGVVFLILGLFILLNEKEDTIEQIKSTGGKRKK